MGIFNFKRGYSEKDYKDNAGIIKDIFLGIQRDSTYGYACQVHVGRISPKISNLYPMNADGAELKRIDDNIMLLISEISTLPKKAKSVFKYFQFLETIIDSRSTGKLNKSNKEIQRTKDIFKKEIEISAAYDEIKSTKYGMKKIEDIAPSLDETEFSKIDVEYGELEMKLQSQEANVAIIVNAYNALIKIQQEEADGKILDEAIKMVPVEEYATIVEKNERIFEEYQMRMEAFDDYSNISNKRKVAQGAMSRASGLGAKVQANQEVKNFESMTGASQPKQYQSSLRDRISGK